MMKWMLAAGAAALAITAPLAAERGGGGNRDRGQAAKVERGGSNAQTARASRGGSDRQVTRAARGGGGDRVRANRSGATRAERPRVERQRSGEARRFSAMQERRGQVERNQARNERLARDRRVDVRQNRIENRAERIDARRNRVDNRAERIEVRQNRIDNRAERLATRDVFRVRDFDRGAVRFRDVDRDDLFVRRLGYGAGGCPPGLAKKPVACMPPGQAARLVGQPFASAARIAALDPLPRSFNSLFWDDDDYYYRYGGGYVYRVDRNDDLIAAMIPLFGAALIGQPLMPSYYSGSYYTPPYFNAFYPNSPYDCYRYGYGYVYETDCMTGMVEDVIPTYDYGYGIGQILPASYSYYNLPYTYRSHFIDDDDYYYRYAPGAIYRVDRDTALISAVAALLTGGLSVGQPLPIGYSAYNVPLAYRDTYYDRPDIWYRYDNGYIYGVDPRTRVVSNVAYVIV